MKINKKIAISGCVEFFSSHSEVCKELSLITELPCVEECHEFDFKLAFYEDEDSYLRLTLSFNKNFLKDQNGIKELKPLEVNFSFSDVPQLESQAPSKNPLLYKAIGIKKGHTKILDLTAGLGEDSFRMALLGADVTALERSPIVYSLLKSGYNVGPQNLVKERLKFLHRESFQYLKGLSEDECPEVIYFDPMFLDKKSKSSREMQILHWILSEEQNNEIDVARLALQKTKYRLVIKRPLKSRPILDGVIHSFKGKSVRYDLYTKT